MLSGVAPHNSAVVGSYPYTLCIINNPTGALSIHDLGFGWVGMLRVRSQQAIATATPAEEDMIADE
jgi:hypothetical protein